MARAPAERPPPHPYALTYSLPDAAIMCGLSVATLRRREAEGLLRFVRVGSRTLVSSESLRAMLGISTIK